MRFGRHCLLNCASLLIRERYAKAVISNSYQFATRQRLNAFINCSILLHGCARAYCENCKHSELIAFSCKRRGLCPSCDAKRGLIFAENLHENVLGPHRVRHLVFSLPKRLRVYFKYDRELTKLLYRAAWEAWLVVTGNLRGNTGMIAALHTAGDLLHFHPHIHAMALDGTVEENGTFHQLTDIDIKKLHDFFQKNVEPCANPFGHKVLPRSPERTGWKLSWLWDSNPQPSDYKSLPCSLLRCPSALVN